MLWALLTFWFFLALGIHAEKLFAPQFGVQNKRDHCLLWFAHPSHMIAKAEKPKILLMFTTHVATYMAVNKPDSWISLSFFPRGPCCSVDEWTHQLRLQWVISIEDLLRYVWSSFQAAPSWSTSHSQRP